MQRHGDGGRCRPAKAHIPPIFEPSPSGQGDARTVEADPRLRLFTAAGDPAARPLQHSKLPVARSRVPESLCKGSTSGLVELNGPRLSGLPGGGGGSGSGCKHPKP